jgi:hypothetical protein
MESPSNTHCGGSKYHMYMRDDARPASQENDSLQHNIAMVIENGTTQD